MNIQEVTTATKVGTFIIRDDKTDDFVKVVWDKDVDKDILKDESGRVYIFTVNDKIYKIGGSTCQKGIKGTMSPYCSNVKGSPSIRTYGVPVLIKEQLDMGNRVDVYLVMSEKVVAPVKGLFGMEDGLVAAFKEMESKCVDDYKHVTGEFPAWNFQESNKAWPSYIQKAHVELLEQNRKK